MKNQEIAKIFYEIARFLQIDKVAFKPYAYERAAVSLEAIKDDVAQIYIKGGRKMLEEIEGIGKAMSDHIEEYLKTGKIKLYEEFKKKVPVQMDELVKVEGLGPRKVKVLYQELGIKNIKDLEKAVKKHTIAPLFGFGEKTEKNIMQGLEFLKQSKGRSLISDIKPVAMEVYKKLENLKEVQKISLAGSLRRGKETIGDVDFLVVSRPDKKYGRGSPREAAKNTQKIMDFFVALPGVKKIWGKGGTKASVHMADGFDMDLRIVPEKSYGAALQYFTGSQDHNIATRKIAIDKGLKLSEYGVFRGSKQIAGKTEEDVYKAIGLRWMDPEIRENAGEIEASLQGKLPTLVDIKDIKGDLHCHSDWNGGKNPIEVMAQTAMDMGYEYIGISDHTKTLKIENGLNDKILKIAKETGTILEINSSQRLDLRDFYIRRAKAEGVKMIINTDSHHKDQMNLMEYGVSQARRGWAEKSDIVNTLSVEKLLEHFKV